MKKNFSKKDKITTEDVIELTKAYGDLKPFFAFFIHCFKAILDSEKEIEEKIKEIQKKTQQELNEDLFLKELWILRYSFLHLWFFELKPPKSQTELEDEFLVINSALKNVLNDRNKIDYLSWLKRGFSEFAGVEEFSIKDLKSFDEDFPNKLAERMARIVFDSTGGRLGGELHDFITELMMTTIQKDRKIFELNDNVALTESETRNIKDIIDGMKPTKKDFEDFVSSISEN